MMIRLEGFELHDLRDWDTGEEQMDFMITQTIEKVRDHDSTLTIIKDENEVVGFTGLDVLWTNVNGRGVAEAWYILNQSAIPDKKDRLLLFWKIRKDLREHAEGLNLCRIQALVECESPAAVRLAALLGFEVECECAKKLSYNETDVKIMAMVM